MPRQTAAIPRPSPLSAGAAPERDPVRVEADRVDGLRDELRDEPRDELRDVVPRPEGRVRVEEPATEPT